MLKNSKAKVYSILSIIILNVFTIIPVISSDKTTKCDLSAFRKIVGFKKENLDEIMGILFFDRGRKNNRNKPSLILNGKIDDSTMPNIYFDNLWHSQNFKYYLESLGQQRTREPTLEEKYDLISGYVHNFLAKYRDEDFVNQIEENALQRRLINYGFDKSQIEDPLKALKDKSQSNLAEIKKMVLESKTLNIDTEIENSVEHLEFFMAHNSHHMEKPPGYPLLAPKEIDDMGLLGFGMSTLPFNRLIDSDRFVYFKVKAKLKNKKPSNLKTEYGDSGVILNHEYASRHVLISPFIMYQEQLHNSIKNIDPEAYDKMLKTNGSINENGRINFSITNRGILGKEEIKNASKNLHHLSFTLEDYEMLVKLILKKHLGDLKLANQIEEYHKWINLLQGEDPLNNLDAQINEIVGKYLKYENKAGFEGVVGGAVPESNLIFFSNNFSEVH